MATKPMKAPGVKGKGGNDRRAAGTQRSPLAPTNGVTGNAPSGMPLDDANVREVQKGTLRPRAGAGVGGSDAALGQVGQRARRATTAGAQFRITTGLPAPQSPEARATQANGRVVPAVMGSKQRANFDAQRGILY